MGKDLRQLGYPKWNGNYSWLPWKPKEKKRRVTDRTKWWKQDKKINDQQLVTPTMTIIE